MKQNSKDIAVGQEFMNNIALVLLASVFVVTCSSSPKKKTPSHVKQAIEASAKQRTPSSTASGFRVGAHTKLAISVYREPDLTTDVLVRSDGTIDYAYVGEISVKGMTPAEVETKIRKILKKDYLVHPQVSVKVREFGRLYIFGKVVNPGMLSIKNELTPLEAVVAAGGFSPGARRNWLKVVRVVNGKKQIYQLSFRKTESGALDLLQSLKLQPEDTILVN